MVAVVEVTVILDIEDTQDQSKIERLVDIALRIPDCIDREVTSIAIPGTDILFRPE